MAKRKQENRYSLFKLPEELENMTVGELVRGYDEVYSRDGKTSVKRKLGVGEVSLEINFEDEQENSGEKISVTAKNSKSDYWTQISEMLSKGMRQKEIAEKLGVSPSYVSQIIKKH